MFNPHKTKKQRITELERKVDHLELRLLALENQPMRHPSPYPLHVPATPPLSRMYREIICEANN